VTISVTTYVVTASRRHECSRPCVAGFVEQNYPGREREIIGRLSQSQPIGRIAEPREVALLALFLCSDEASFITGVDYPINGGFINIR